MYKELKIEIKKLLTIGTSNEDSSQLQTNCIIQNISEFLDTWLQNFSCICTDNYLILFAF